MTMVVRMRLLGGLLGLLLLALAGVWLWPQTEAAESAPRALREAALHRAGVPARQTRQWAEAVLARPLFSINRRPPRVAAGTGTQMAAGSARLSGIIIEPGRRVALFAPDGGGREMVISVGGGINDSTIRDIEPDNVILANGMVLHPSFDRNRSPAAPVVPQMYQPPVQQTFTPPNFQRPNFEGQNFQPPFGPPGMPGGPDEQNGAPGQMPFRPVMPPRRE